MNGIDWEKYAVNRDSSPSSESSKTPIDWDQYAASEKKSLSFGGKLSRAAGIFGEDLSNLPEAALEKITGAISAAPSEIAGTLKQSSHGPLRGAENEVIGRMGLLSDIYNSGNNMRKYMGHLGLLSDGTANKYPEIPNPGEVAIRPTMGAEQPGDWLETHGAGLIGGAQLPGVKQAVSALSFLPKYGIKGAGTALKDLFYHIPAEGSAKSALQTAESGLAPAIQDVKNAEDTAKASGSSDPVVLQKQINKHQKAIENLHNALAETPPTNQQEQEVATKTIGEATANYNAAKSQAVREINKSDPDKIQYSINLHQKKIDDLQKKVSNGESISPDEMREAKENLQAATDAHEQAKGAAIDRFKTANTNQLNNRILENQEKLSGLQDELKSLPPEKPADIQPLKDALGEANVSHEVAQHRVNEANNAIRQHLNPDSDYQVNTSRMIRHRIQSIEDYHSDEYRNMMHDLGQSDFQLANADRLPRIEEAANRAREQYGEDPEGIFARTIRLAPSAADRSASDFMMHQKDFRDARYDLLQQARHNPSATQRNEYYRAYRALAPFQDLVNETLREGLGEHIHRYDQLQEGYRTQIYPLRENNVASNIMEGKKMSGDIAGELAGDEVGQGVLREIANREPEIRRNIVGQQYKKNTDLVHNPDERLREYTNQMPELNALVNHREQALNSAEAAANQLQQAQNSHDAGLKINQAHAKELAQYAENKSALESKAGAASKKIDLLQKFKDRLKDTENQKIDAVEKHTNLDERNKILEKQRQKDAEINEQIENMKTHVANLQSHEANIRNAAGQIGEKTAPVRETLRAKQSRDNMLAKINQIQQELPLLQKNRENLMVQLNRRDIKQAEYNKAKKRVDEINDAEKRIFRKLIVGVSLFGVGGTAYGIYKHNQ
jgi:hypothetical protein